MIAPDVLFALADEIDEDARERSMDTEMDDDLEGWMRGMSDAADRIRELARGNKPWVVLR